MATGTRSRWTLAGVVIVLVAGVWLVFGQTVRYDFVNYDDDLYVYDNAIVTKGLTWPGVRWAFTYPHARNWHPLTTISHMLDCQFYGLNAGGHHFTSVLLHSISVLLLLLLLRSLVSSVWSSAFVAALFAIHPQHVESVAWISERKDVLSGMFFMLTLATYVRYARRPSLARYVTMSILFVGGLMSKPMLVTVPFVLLLLDYWPLNRGQRSDVTGQKSAGEIQVWLRLIAEKIPLFVLSAVAGLITFLIQVRGGALTDPAPLGWRIENAIVSCFIYVWQMLWPANLSAFYPQNPLPLWEVALAFAFLVGVTAVVIALRRRRPYLFVGWFWYLVMLAPVVGVIQVGEQAWADRYTYLPHLGLYLGVTCLIVDLTEGLRHRRAIAGACTVLVLGAFLCLARLQTTYWRNSESLWTRALDVTSGNHVAHNNLGVLLGRRGQVDQSLQHFEAALAIRLQHRTPRYDLSQAIYHTNIADVLRKKGQVDDAIRHAQTALALQPNYGYGLSTLAGALMDKGRVDEAIPLYRQALEIYRADPETEVNFAAALLQKGMSEEAVAHFEKALSFDPNNLKALNNLAWVYATSPDPSLRNGPKAVALAERAVRISGVENPFYLHKLAAAYAEAGDFSQALAVAERALQLATDQTNPGLAAELQRNIEVYRTKSPLRDMRRPK
jgi:tetratricopeptide (TPR) repeat protein